MMGQGIERNASVGPTALHIGPKLAITITSLDATTVFHASLH